MSELEEIQAKKFDRKFMRKYKKRRGSAFESKMIGY